MAPAHTSQAKPTHTHSIICTHWQSHMHTATTGIAVPVHTCTACALAISRTPISTHTRPAVPSYVDAMKPRALIPLHSCRSSLFQTAPPQSSQAHTHTHTHSTARQRPAAPSQPHASSATYCSARAAAADKPQHQQPVQLCACLSATSLTAQPATASLALCHSFAQLSQPSLRSSQPPLSPPCLTTAPSGSMHAQPRSIRCGLAACQA